MSLRHDYQRSIRWDDERRTPLRITQKRARSNHSAELLGPVVPADAPGQRTKAKSLPASQDHDPRPHPTGREPAAGWRKASTSGHERERGPAKLASRGLDGFPRRRSSVSRLPTFAYACALPFRPLRPRDQHGTQDESERKRAGDSNDRDLQHSAPPVESSPGSIH